MTADVKYRDIVREIALDQYGYVTTGQAADAGVPAVELPKLAARGGLQHVAYGLYRLSDAVPHDLDQYAEALLRAGEGAFLRAESVLAMFGLADLNPRRVNVGVRRRTRTAIPAFVELTLVRGNWPTTRYEGLESQSVADAILECRGRIETDRLIDATLQARKEGLVTASEHRHVMRGLRP